MRFFVEDDHIYAFQFAHGAQRAKSVTYRRKDKWSDTAYLYDPDEDFFHNVEITDEQVLDLVGHLPNWEQV